MKTTLTILLALIAVTGWCQEAYWRFENNTTDDMGNHDLVIKDGATFVATYPLEGSYRAYFYDNKSTRMITENKVDLSSGEFTINLGIRSTNSANITTVFTNQASLSVKGIELRLDASNDRLIFEVDDGVDNNVIATGNGSLPTNGTWHYVTIRTFDANGQYFTIWIDGVLYETDSTLIAGGGVNDTISLGAARDGESSMYAGIDNVSIYKSALTDAQIEDLYDHMAENYTISEPASPGAYSPIAGRHLWFTKGGNRLIPSKYGIQKYILDKNYKNVEILSHDQYMVTYDGAVNNDIVGTFDPWFPREYELGGTFAYTLTDDEGGIYAINSSTGVVTIADNSGMEAGTDTLSVNVSHLGKTSNYNIYVTVRDESVCHFIDNTELTNGAGTRADPYNTWSGITFQAGHAYFQKRGTDYNQQIFINVDGSAGNEIIFAAYGTGDKPQITNLVSVDGMYVTADYIWIFDYYFENCRYGIFFFGDDLYQYARISDCEFNSNGVFEHNGQLYFLRYKAGSENNWYHEVYDCVAYNENSSATSQYGIKIEGSGVKVRNFKGYNNNGMAISVPMWGHRDTLSGILGYNNSRIQVELSGKYHEISNSYLSGGNNAIAISDSGSYGTTIRNNTLIGGSYMGALAILCTTEGLSYGGDHIVENNIIKNSSKSGIWVDNAVTNTTIRYNTISGCDVAGIYFGYTNTGIEIANIYYNVLYNNTTDIKIVGGDYINITNNTITGTVTIDPSSGTFVNNFYQTLTVPVGLPTFGSVDIDAISTSDYFKDYAGFDFRLKSTATDAINQGISNGLTRDIIGTPINGLPDIGAYEYIP